MPTANTDWKAYRHTPEVCSECLDADAFTTTPATAYVYGDPKCSTHLSECVVPATDPGPCVVCAYEGWDAESPIEHRLYGDPICEAHLAEVLAPR